MLLLFEKQIHYVVQVVLSSGIPHMVPHPAHRLVKVRWADAALVNGKIK